MRNVDEPASVGECGCLKAQRLSEFLPRACAHAFSKHYTSFERQLKDGYVSGKTTRPGSIKRY